MNTLDNVANIDSLDQGHSLESIAMLADQCESAWEDVKNMTLPEEYRNATSILFCGMGGSAYGARLIRSLFPNQIKVPVDLVSDYHIPAYVNKDTLVIVASYSGGTEETLSCIEEAQEKGAMVLGISAGGALQEAMARYVRPTYTFVPKFNPSSQPRLGQGYMQMGQIGMLAKLGYLSVTDEDVAPVIEMLRNNVQKFSKETPTAHNPAKEYAQLYKDKIVNLIGAEFLEGAIHAIRNPFHETGKHFANYFIVPELNHHLMEGLLFPEFIKTGMLFTLIESNLYGTRIQKRMLLTKEVIEKNGIATQKIRLTAPTKMGQAFELIQLGSYVTFYLGIAHDQDPAKIPWVDYFKSNLKS